MVGTITADIGNFFQVSTTRWVNLYLRMLRCACFFWILMLWPSLKSVSVSFVMTCEQCIHLHIKAMHDLVTILPLSAHRWVALLPKWIEFNCLRSAAVGKALEWSNYCQEAASQVAMLHLRSCTNILIKEASRLWKHHKVTFFKLGTQKGWFVTFLSRLNWVQ